MTAEPKRPAPLRSSAAPALRAAARAVAAVSACFCVLLGLALMGGQARMARADVLNDRGLLELRRRFAADPDNDDLKQLIRAADLEIRRVYFAHQERTHSGARLLLGGFLTLLASLAVLPLLGAAMPDLAALEAQPSEWRRRRLARRGLAAGGLALAALAALAAWALRSAPEREPVVSTAPPETLSAPSAAPAETPPPLDPDALPAHE